MRKSKTLQKLRENSLVRVCSLGHDLPPYIRHAAQYGFDCIWLDLEHRPLDVHQVQKLLAISHLADIDVMIRVGYREPNTLYRYLEDGASGLMCALISNQKQAEEIVQATKFPPLGNRGFDGAMLDSDYLLKGGEGYPEAANRETFLLAQIETVEAVHNIEAIASVNGIDALFIGWKDLSLRIKNSPDISWELEDIVERVNSAVKAQGKHWGAVTENKDEMKKRFSQGGRFLPCIGEFTILMNALEQKQVELNSLFGDRGCELGLSTSFTNRTPFSNLKPIFQIFKRIICSSDRRLRVLLRPPSTRWVAFSKGSARQALKRSPSSRLALRPAEQSQVTHLTA